MCQHPAGHESSGQHTAEHDPQLPRVSVGGRREIIIHGGTWRGTSGLQRQRQAGYAASFGLVF